jgi:hypothetical protein
MAISLGFCNLSANYTQGKLFKIELSTGSINLATLEQN